MHLPSVKTKDEFYVGLFVASEIVLSTYMFVYVFDIHVYNFVYDQFPNNIFVHLFIYLFIYLFYPFRNVKNNRV